MGRVQQRRVPASRDLGAAALVSAQTRTRPPRDTLDRLERAAPHANPERPQIEGRLNLVSTQASWREKRRPRRRKLCKKSCEPTRRPRSATACAGSGRRRRSSARRTRSRRRSKGRSRRRSRRLPVSQCVEVELELELDAVAAMASSRRCRSTQASRRWASSTRA